MAYSQDFSEIIKAFQESYKFENTGEYLQSIKTLEAVYDENSYEINLRLGWLNYQSGKFNESMALYNKAISIFPYAIEAKFGLVLPAAALAKWDLVIDQYDKILEIDPKNTYANYRLGFIYYERKEYEKAHSYFEKVVNLYPFDYDGLLMFAWTKFQLHQLREAKILFNKVLMYSPEDKSAQEGLSLIK